MGAEMSEEWTDSLLNDAIRQAVAKVDRDALFTKRDKIARAALSAIESSGYVLVPKEMIEVLAANPTNQEIEASIKATDYKYFGDYPLSEGQWDAVTNLIVAGRLVVAVRDAMLSARPKVTT